VDTTTRWFEHPLFEEDIQRLSTPDLDQATEYVKGDRVVPARTGLEHERAGAPVIDGFGQGGTRFEDEVISLGAIDGVDGVNVLKAIGQAAGVSEEMVHPHWFDRRNRLGLHRRATREDLRLSQRVDPLPDVVGEIEKTLFIEHHGRRRDDRLGHGVDPPDRVVLDAQVTLAVSVAAFAGPDELTPA
jgi:hypothetical protein